MAAFNQFPPGGVVWSGEPQRRERPYPQQFQNLFIAATAATGMYYGAYHSIGGKTSWQRLSQIVSTAEAAIPPFQWTKTFRLSGVVSSFAAPSSYNIPGRAFTALSGAGQRTWASPTAMKYWSTILNKPASELEKLGLFEHGLQFQRYANRPYGFSGTISIGGAALPGEFNLTRIEGLTPDQLSRAHLSLLDEDLASQLQDASIGLKKQGAGKAKLVDRGSPLTAKEVLAAKKRVVKEGIFAAGKSMPEFTVERALWGGAGLTKARTYAAFSLQRLSNLFAATFSWIPGGEYFKHFIPPPGSAAKMPFRWAGRAALIAGIYGGIAQLDWAQRADLPFAQAGYGALAAGLSRFAFKRASSTSLAIGAGVGLLTGLPIFDKGISQGAATAYMRFEMGRSRLSHAPIVRNLPIVGAKYREWIADTFPGMDDPGMAAVLGGGIGIAAGMMTRAYAMSRGGMSFADAFSSIVKNSYYGDFISVMRSYGYLDPTKWYKPLTQRGKVAPLTGVDKLLGKDPKTFLDAVVKSFKRAGQMSKRTLSHERYAVQEAERKLASEILSQKNLTSRVLTQLEGYVKGVDPSAALSARGAWKDIHYFPIKRWQTFALAGVATYAVLTGQLAKKKSPEDLKELMAGEELVPVKRGRYWEAGNAPFEGLHTLYSRPHFYAMMTSRARQKALWGSDEDRLSPVHKWFLKNFTYELEKRNYDTRPYPISNVAFQNVPMVGPILAASVGRLVKPARLLHVEDWIRPGIDGGPETEVMHRLSELESQPAATLGGQGPGMPISPFSSRALAGEQLYNLTEMSGLVGFMTTKGFGFTPSLQTITGRDSLFSQDTWLESSNKMYNASRLWWEQELGGLASLSESLRRFIPRPRTEIGQFNPIANKMPYWLPDQLRYGDPYSRLPYGEARLPGPGYAGLYPELEGVAPENYPIEHQYAILSDVAWYSREFRAVQARAKQLQAAGALTKEASLRIERAEKRLEDRKKRLQFDEYIDKYNEETETWSELRRGMGRSWQRFTHSMTALAGPAEYILPFGIRPISKLAAYRSPVEEYEQSLLYGCLGKGTWIWTEDGIKDIEDILEGDFVVGDDGERHRVRRVFKRTYSALGLQAKCLSVAGLSGTDIVLTEDHRLLIGPEQWKETRLLKRGDLLASPIKRWMIGEGVEIDITYPYRTIFGGSKLLLRETPCLAKVGSYRQDKLLGCNKSRWARRFVLNDKRFMYLIGLYLAEGNLGYQNNLPYRVCFSLHVDEQYLRDRISDIVSDIFGLKTKELRQKENCYVTYINNVLVACLFAWLCPGTARNKRLNTGVFPTSKEGLISLLKGLIDGDGHIEKQANTMALRTSSRSLALLALDVSAVLGCLGILIRNKPGGFNKKEGSWSIKWNGEEYRKLYKLLYEEDYKVSVDKRTAGRTGHIVDGFIYRKIRKVQDENYNYEYVYDLEVEDCHSFGGVHIVYHNSRMAFWDKPKRDWLRPAMWSALHEWVGYDGVPPWLREVRELQEYYDKLEYYKWKNLEQGAIKEGDDNAAREYGALARKTVYGRDPYERGEYVRSSLPRTERDYFEAFAATKNPQERERILEMVPEYMRSIYTAQWQRADFARTGDKRLGEIIKKSAETGGMPITEDAYDNYRATAPPGMAYGDWARLRELKGYFKENPMPRPDWVGFCVPEDQKLYLCDESITTAKDIKEGNVLLTKGDMGEVVSIYKRKPRENEKIYSVRVHHDLAHSMRATENHLILAIKARPCCFNPRPSSICNQRSNLWRCFFCENKYYNNYSLEWIPIKELDLNTFLPIPKLHCSDNNPTIDLSQYKYSGNIVYNEEALRPKTGMQKPMKRFIELNEAVLWMVGFYLGDGNIWVTENRVRGVQFTAGKENIAVLELTKKIIERYFGLSPRIVPKKNSNVVYLVVASGMFGEVMHQWAGRYCDKKTIPPWIHQITRSGQWALLEGLLDSDGSKDDHDVLAIANYDLSRMAKRIWEAHGIPSSIRIAKKIYNYKTIYVTRPLSSSLNAILGEDYIAYRICDIESSYDTVVDVYDFEVSPNSSYCCPIGIYHNSPAVDLEDVRLKVIETQGADIHDYGLWESQQRLLARKPYINTDTIKQVQPPYNSISMRRLIGYLAKETDVPVTDVGIYQYYTQYPRNDFEVDMYDNRQTDKLKYASMLYR